MGSVKAVIGFPKCGTMSLVEWLKKKYPNDTISRPENIYIDVRMPKQYEKWYEIDCWAITRDPVSRIKSGIQYWPEVTKRYNEKGIRGVLEGFKRYENVGFKNPIQQSNYDYYVKKFERERGAYVRVVKFEDMIKDSDFPHINESNTKIKLPDSDIEIIKRELEKAEITY